MVLTTEQKAIVTATVPLLEAHGLEVTKVFYHNVLNDFPTLKDLFSLSAQITDHQAKALAGAVHAYAANINDLSPILPVVERINQKHVSLDISAPLYAVVGEYLLKAFRQVLGSGVFTDAVEEAWGAAYWQLANLMIKREDDIYNAQVAEVGGWKGFRQMRLARKVVESSEITSFYWTPVDGGVLPTFKPGQYISIRVDLPDGGKQIRQYSLSDAPPQTQANHTVNGTTQTNGATHTPQYYRNSIKREEGEHPGQVSNILHKIIQEGDIVEMSQPAGDFFLDQESNPSNSQAPLILISAGVGQTPLLSITNTLTSAKSLNRPISYIHTARNSSTHAFASHIASLASSNPSLRSITFHSQPEPNETQSRDYDFAGRLNLDFLDAEKDLYLSNQDAEYFVCGPGKFMMGVATWLAGKGVDNSRVQMEVFGAGDVAMARQG